MTQALLLKHIAKLSTQRDASEKDWGYRMERIGDYSKDEHYYKLDGSIRFGLRITYNPPECTILYYHGPEEVQK